MDDREFDQALLGAAFDLAAEIGWPRMRVAAAARRAGLPLDRARLRFPHRGALLMQFGRQVDASALANATDEGGPRDRLFDLLMQRFEAMQVHRAGMLALLRALPAEPPLALLLAAATRRSMGWMLEGAGISTAGLNGHLRVSGAVAVWMYTLRAWRTDTSEDLTGTMAALDRALARAEQAAGWLASRRRAAPLPEAEPEELADDALPATAPEAVPETPASPPTAF